MKQNLKDFGLALAFMITLTTIYLTTIYFL